LGIDHIFIRPGREGQHVIVEATRIVGDAVDGVFPSDHRAVVADLRWRG
jgi:endonuclease/exonuclease/phosphatase family metal-dependent hydrolase